MIDRAYCVTMARYNHWQNNQLYGLLEALKPTEISLNREAFFGSILGTLNHLLWGDLMWMARFDGGDKPQGGPVESVTMHATLRGWMPERRRMDARVSQWAGSVSTEELHRDMTWFSGILNREIHASMGLCVTHMFNHQTHHRGQVHAMLTAAGSEAPVSDLFLMPDEV